MQGKQFLQYKETKKNKKQKTKKRYANPIFDNRDQSFTEFIHYDIYQHFFMPTIHSCISP